MSLTNPAPRRLQLSRRKGWRLPAGAANVARPTAWGNPFRVGDVVGGYGVVETRAAAVELYRTRVLAAPHGHDYAELRGRDLACWCPLDGPCHADLLLERANRPEHRAAVSSTTVSRVDGDPDGADRNAVATR